MSAPLRRVWGAVTLLFVAACGGARARALSASPAAPIARAECPRSSPTTCGGAAPSYVRDVAPILSKRCFGCHSGDGEAAEDHDFARWPTLYAQRNAIAIEVSACAMPPRRAPQLQPDEAAALLRWVACGASHD